MTGGLLVAGTASDAGKSVVTAGICRWLARRGIRVAPFKAQNMALNSVVTPGGAEIGRAQAMQAAAAGVEPEAAMNPILIKPAGDTESQVVVMGRPYADVSARSYRELREPLRDTVQAALADLRARFDVVICEGAGSPAEINLRAGDLANMGLARAAGLPVLLVGDIDRGGVFASLYGTLALLDAEDQRLIGGFLINKFRGDRTILQPGLDAIRELTGRSALGVLPWRRGLWMDVEDSLALEAPAELSAPPVGRDGLEVAVIRLRWMSNFTDVDALAAEPGVRVRFTRSAVDVARADLVIVPGTKATVADLERLRHDGLDRALVERAGRGDPVLAICGGYQMLGGRIEDAVESRAGIVTGLGLLPVTTRFDADKLLRRSAGSAFDVPVSGYEIRHGRVTRHGGEALIAAEPTPSTGPSPNGPARAAPEGCRADAVLGTSWHGILEGDAFRRALLRWVAARRERAFVAGSEPFAAVRERRLDALGDLIEEHADTAAIERLIERGADPDLPIVGSGVAACSPS